MASLKYFMNIKTVLAFVVSLSLWSIYRVQHINDSSTIRSRANQSSHSTLSDSEPFPEIPALVLIGPAKTGTRSLIDALSEFPDNVQYQSERHFWSGSKDYSCRPWYSDMEWQRFITGFTTHSLNFSTTMTQHIMDHTNNSKCTVYRYQQRWRGRRVREVLSSRCQFNEDGLTPCYLMEKGPSYINSPWVAAIFSVKMPRIKVLGIVRNPIHHVWSCYYAFGRIMNVDKSGFETDRHRIERYILKRINTSQSFHDLRGLSEEINTAWDVLSWSNMDKKHRHKEMMRKWYPKLMALYLRLRFIFPKDILITLRRDAFMWFPMSAVNVIFWMYSYEEMGITEQFRLIQFEYVVKDIDKASQKVQCWLRNMDSHCVFPRERVETDSVEKDSESEIEGDSGGDPGGQRKKNKNHAMYDEGPGSRFGKSLTVHFDPFKLTLLHLMKDQRDLRIGKWIPWDQHAHHRDK